MVAGFTLLLAKIVALAKWFDDLFVAIFKAAWDFIRDAFCWPFEQLLEIVVSAVNAIDVSGFDGAIGAWGDLPGEVINILALIGVPVAMGIISAAIAIRLGLQLIPFVRLGS